MCVNAHRGTAPWEPGEQLCFPWESQQHWEHVFNQSCAESCRVPRTSQVQLLLVKIHLPCALLIDCVLQLGP